jgi:hypothetical protein
VVAGSVVVLVTVVPFTVQDAELAPTLTFITAGVVDGATPMEVTVCDDPLAVTHS